MAVAYVQSANYATVGASGSSGNAVLGAAPTPGNYLVGAYVNWSNLSGTIPTGWTLLDAYNTTGGGVVQIKTFYRVAQSGDSATIPAVMSASDDWCFMVAEYSGVGGIESYANHSQAAESAATLTTAAVVPSHLSDMVIAIFGHTRGSVDGYTPQAIGSGWTADQQPNPRYNAGLMGHRNSLTTDTTTAVSAVITESSGAAAGTRDIGSSLILLYPSGGSTPNPGQFFAFF